MNSDDTNQDRTTPPLSELQWDEPFEVEFTDELWRAGFTVVPNLIIDSKLSPRGTLLLIVLMRHAFSSDTCWPGQERLGQLVGVKPRSVRTYLRELERAGLLETEKRGYQQSNRYRLLTPTRQKLAALTDRQPVAAEETLVLTTDLQPPATTAPQGRAHASAPARTGEAAPDPKPPGAQDVIAAWIDARRAAGKTTPVASIKARMGTQVRRLIKDGVPVAVLIEAVGRMARARREYGPGALATFTDGVINGEVEGDGQSTLAAAWEHDPFVPGRVDEHA